MSLDFNQLTQQCDAAIKAGRPNEVRRLLSRVPLNRVPREWRLPLARICRRAGLASVGLKLLSKLVLNEQTSISERAVGAERAEYAVLLQRSGALNEAMNQLDLVDFNEVPEARLYRAFVHFARWEFKQAADRLHDYLLGNLTEHAHLVGQLNLAFAWTESRQHVEAISLIEELEKAAVP